MHNIRTMRALVAACLVGAIAADHAATRVTVDLDKQPEHRWDHVVAAHNQTFHKALNEILASPKIKKFVPAVKKLVGNKLVARRILPDEQFREVQGIASAMGIDMAEVVLLTTFYDIFAAKGSPVMKNQACTGIVAQSSTGEIFHGRNLDYAFTAPLAAITLHVDFVRNGTTLFSAVTFGPNPTFNTAVRYGAFSVTQDERDRGNIGENLFDILIRGRVALFASFRQALETIDSFDDAVDFFGKVKLSAASYFIIGGTKPGEGAIITRNRDGVDASVPTWRLNASAGTWFVRETNYDHTVAPRFGDNRRAVIDRAMNATGPTGFRDSSMWKVISTSQNNKEAGERGVLNTDTIYSAVMQAAHRDSMKVVVRVDAKPGREAIIV